MSLFLMIKLFFITNTIEIEINSSEPEIKSSHDLCAKVETGLPMTGYETV
jgi:hypothetical protein